MVKHIKVIVEKHPDGYVACPLGLQGVIVSEGDTYEEALADVQSAMTFHTTPLRHFGFQRQVSASVRQHALAW